MKYARSAASLVASFLCLVVVGRTPSICAGTAVRLELEEMVRAADLVFEGRVLAEHAFRDAHGRVVSEYTLSVHATYWGEPRGTQVIRLPGGALGDGSGTLIAGMPTLTVGEDALLFLSQIGARDTRMPVGLAQGKFKVARDAQGVATLVRSQADLMLVDPRSGALAPAQGWSVLDYDATIERIEKAADARRAAPLEAR